VLATIPDRLTKELRKLNKSLEKKVLQKTKELKEFNQKLEIKVKEEVDKNRDKDKILFQQSRQAVMGEMISTIAHHWRQPLSLINTIIANQKVQMLMNNTDQKSLEDSLNEIEIEIKKLSDIINEFRNFFQPHNKAKEKFDLDNPIDEAIKLAISSFGKKNINIEKKYVLTNKIVSYRSEIIQVIVSTIKNSIEAFDRNNTQNPNIIINGIENSNNYIIEIIDNGGGIDEEIIDKVTDPYFSTKKSKNGTGLGLYISKIIAQEYLGGSIDVQNSQNGTKIILILSKV
jgi:C4-dicarboxylate-specific signal transduction histidine kinase